MSFFDGEYVDVHLVLAYESEYKKLDCEYADNPGEYGTRICLNNDNPKLFIEIANGNEI